MADTYMGRVTCSYTRCILEAADEGRYNALDGIVFVTSCDHMRRLHDNLNYLHEPRNIWMLDLPHKDTDEAVGWYATELKQLAEGIQEAFQVAIDDGVLAESIRKSNRLRRAITALDELRSRPAPQLTGAEMIALTTGATAMDIGEAARLVEELKAIVEAGAGRQPKRSRLVLAASQLDNPDYVQAIEKVGALIVGEVCCTAPTAYRGEVDEQAPPLEALAARYLRRVPCPRMMEGFDRLLGEVKRMVAERRADGVILSSMKFCDTWGLDGALLVRTLREEGVPVLRLEREYFLSGEGQIATRVQAFMESMDK
jgi:benzoyl-CoA reductase/2-hydroxyglutaryl-CoA dehydratase subunit BcrC/BadD/HgdB